MRCKNTKLGYNCSGNTKYSSYKKWFLQKNAKKENFLKKSFDINILFCYDIGAVV